MNLRDALAESAADVDGVATSAGADGSLAYVAGGQTVAVVAASGTSAEFRLSPPVAAAAIRTPDATASSRGAEWVRFAPAELDDHAIDRAVAWLGFAVRHATQN